MLACLFGILSVISGYFLAVQLNVSITGAMVTVSGVVFGLVFTIIRLKGSKSTVSEATAGI
jgi:manganese/zinc/iron transport system permease protein